MSTDWEKELAKIDKQLASLSDDKLIAAADAQTPARPATVKGEPAAKPSLPPSPQRARWGVIGRVALAAGLGVALPFWPYDAACGIRLFAYLAALGVLTATGMVAAISSWRHRSAVGHVVSLVVIVWALTLSAAVVLPRVGYAADPAAPATWLCP